MLDAYQIEEPLGRGGMGEVFRATHLRSGVPLAVKVVHDHLVNNEKDRRSFRREVEAMASMNHRSIVRIFDLGEVSESNVRFTPGTPWFAMEIARGGSFEAGWVSNFSDLLRVLLDLLDALAYAHARGIVHRDLKPDNVLLDGDDLEGWRPILTDFGLAHTIDPDEELTDSELNGAAGTPAYMAPEQFHGAWRSYGPWTDIYSLGCMAWQLACDGPPFQASGMLQLALKHSREPLPPLAPRFPVPKYFESWLKRCTEKEPVHRFRSAADASFTLFSILRADAEEWPPAPALRGRGHGEHSLTLPTLTMNLNTIQIPSRALASIVKQDARSVDAIEVLHPPVPGHALDPTTPPPFPLRGVGLNLFGLRQIPFVDRQRERTFLWNALRDVCNGEMKTFVLEGPTGVGKSRLAHWVATRAREVGAARVISVRHSALNSPLHGLTRALKVALGALELEGKDLLHHLEDVLEDWLELAGTELSQEELDARANEVAQLLVPSVPEGMPRVTFESPEQRYILTAWLLNLMSQDRPLVVLFDDAHFGADSLGFVHYLLRNHANLAALMILCIGDTSKRPAEAELIAALLDRVDIGRIAVKELKKADREEFVRALIPLEDRSIHRMVRATGGHPSQTIQAISDLIASESLRPGPQGYTIEAKEAFTREVQNVWTRTLRRLIVDTRDEDASLCLEVGAALGNQIVFDEWHAACAAAGVVIPPTVLDIASRMGLVEEFDDSWNFKLKAFADHLRDDARETGRWQKIHAACASIELTDPQSGTSRHERYAYHHQEAGDLRLAANALTEAVKDLMARSAYLQARVVARDAEDRLARLGVPPEAPERINLFTVQLECVRFQGRFAEAQTEMDAGEARVHACPDPGARANAFRAFANLAYFSSQHDESMAWFQRAFDAAPEDDFLLLAKLHHGIGWILSNTPQLENAVSHFRAGAAAAADAKDAAERAWCLHGLADVMYRLGNENGESLARESCRLFEEVGSRTGWATASSVCGDFARRNGHSNDARAFYEDSARQLEKVGSIVESMVRSRLAMLHFVEGRRNAALQTARISRARFGNAMIPLRVITELLLAILEPDADIRAARRADAERLLATARYVHPDVDYLLGLERT